jgi:hypothetical protein
VDFLAGQIDVGVMPYDQATTVSTEDLMAYFLNSHGHDDDHEQDHDADEQAE